MTSKETKIKSKKGVPLKCGNPKCRKFKSECKCGPPTKKDEKTVGKLIEAFKRGFSVEQACNYAGINKTTMYDWTKKDEKLSNEIARARQYVNEAAKKVLQKAIVEGENLNAAMWFLERRESDLYSSKSVHEVAPTTTKKLDEKRKEKLSKLLEQNGL